MRLTHCLADKHNEASASLFFFFGIAMVTVGNLKSGDEGIFIGRPSALGNPFSIGSHKTREEVIARHAEWIHQRVAQDDAVICNALNEIYFDAAHKPTKLICFCKPKACHGDVIAKLVNDHLAARQNVTIQWSRGSIGYECSSAGDSRFSALYAVLEDGRTIEQHYQCDVKGYEVGGKNWRIGKGKPPLQKNVNLWDEYYKLWMKWARMNMCLMQELFELACDNNFTLSDQYARSDVNQVRALSLLCNTLFTTS